MVSKKLGFIKKTIGKYGKRLFWWKTEKINLFLIVSIVQAVIEVYQEIKEGSLPEALESLAKGAEAGAGDIVTDLIENPIMFGIGMKFLLSKDIRDVALQIGWTLWALAGNDSGRLLGKPVFIPAEEAEEGVPKIIVSILKCPMCATQGGIKPEDLGGYDYFHVITALAGSAVQHVEDYVGNEYTVICKETKCFLRGDDKGEITAFFYPKGSEPT